MSLPYNTIETSLLGTGGGYGESIVLHLGNGDWMMVDSCVDPESNTVIALEYLNAIGVDVEKKLKHIVCTHWHDDHISGISQVLEKAKNATLYHTRANDRKKFLQLMGYDYHKIKSRTSLTSTYELNNCIEIVNSRGSIIKTAVQDRLLFSNNANGISTEVWSLTPSDFILNEFDKEISTLMAEFVKTNKKIVFEKPNDKSIVLLIKINSIRILLGSDLEVTTDKRKGWLCVLDSCSSLDEIKSSIFKIPHHGSKNGYHPRIWDEIVEINAISKLTPWNRGKKLPQREMLEKYLAHTTNLYATSQNSNNKPKPKKREKRLAKAINGFNNTLREIKCDKGIIQCRLDVLNETKWNVVLFEKAYKVDQDIINKI